MHAAAVVGPAVLNCWQQLRETGCVRREGEVRGGLTHGHSRLRVTTAPTKRLRSLESEEADRKAFARLQAHLQMASQANAKDCGEALGEGRLGLGGRSRLVAVGRGDGSAALAGAFDHKKVDCCCTVRVVLSSGFAAVLGHLVWQLLGHVVWQVLRLDGIWSNR